MHLLLSGVVMNNFFLNRHGVVHVTVVENNSYGINKMRNLIANKTSNFENNYTNLNLNIRPTFFFFLVLRKK